MKLGSFFAELKRRNVYKVAVGYAVVGWLLIQVATQVFPFFEIPNWGVRLIVLLIVVGFPIALVIAWAFELTPGGIKRTEEADRVYPGRSRGRAWIYVVISAGLLSAGLFFLGRYTAPNENKIGECAGKINCGPALRKLKPGSGQRLLRRGNSGRNSDATGKSRGLESDLAHFNPALQKLPG